MLKFNLLMLTFFEKYSPRWGSRFYLVVRFDFWNTIVWFIPYVPPGLELIMLPHAPFFFPLESTLESTTTSWLGRILHLQTGASVSHAHPFKFFVQTSCAKEQYKVICVDVLGLLGAKFANYDSLPAIHS